MDDDRKRSANSRVGMLVRHKGSLARLLVATVPLVALMGASMPAAALTIIGTFDGSAFSPVPYYTCGVNWNCADPATHSAPLTPNTQWVVNTFNAAARYWEQRIDDPWTVTIQYGFANLGSGPGSPSGVTSGGNRVNGRYTTADIRINSTVLDWFLSPNPWTNNEFQPYSLVKQTLPVGASNGVSLTTALATAAIPYGPDSVSTVLCPPITGVPCGAHQDLLGIMIHELAHALNLETSNLRPLESVHVDSQFGLIRIPNGPFAGTTVPWTTIGGGHTFLKPSPGAAYLFGPNPTPFGYSDTRLDSPSGLIAANAVFGYGSHRLLVTDLDAIVIASVSNFKRVNLDGLNYVALPNFDDVSILSLTGAGARAASAGGAVLRLTDDVNGQRGGAFLTNPLLLGPDSSLQTHFSFRITGAQGSGAMGSDGLAFVIHSDPRGAAAIGNAGEGLGFGINDTNGNPSTPIRPSLAIEFDTHKNVFDSDGNHVGLILNGDVRTHLARVSLPCPDGSGFPCLNSGDNVYVWIDYDGVSNLLRVFLADRPVMPPTPYIAATVDLYSLIGARAFLGFTAGTGEGSNVHDVLSWDATVLPNMVPASLGDLNGDGQVNCSDLSIVKASFGRMRGQPGFDPHADVNGDGMVNIRDLTLVTQKLAMGTTCQ